MPFDYSSLKSVHFTFTNEKLNAHAADVAPEFTDFFTHNGDLDDELLIELQAQVILLLTLNCSETTQEQRISSLVDKVCFKYYSITREHSLCIRNHDHIVEAFQDTVKGNATTVKIEVITTGLIFHPLFKGDNLDYVATSVVDFPNTIKAIPSPSSLERSPSSLEASSSSLGSTPLGTSASITQPSSWPSNEFRHNRLPSDVKKRYDDHQNPDIIIPVKDLVPFLATKASPTPLKYFHQPDIAGDKVILRNGSVLSAQYDSKKFHKTVPYCPDASYHGLRIWYRLFSGHGNSCGIYVVPYELLTKDHGGAIGFAFDDDLPAFKSGSFFEWQSDLLRALQHSSMFPPDSTPAHRVKGLSNGYYAILAILTDSHPAFISHPISLCKNWPEQKAGQTIFNFHSEFVEAIALRAIFMDGAQDLNSATMLSTFMQNCTHSTYLIAAARMDALDPTTKQNLSPGNLAITLNNYLSRPDSPSIVRAPVQHTPRTSPARFGEGSSGFRARPFQRRINALGEEDDPNYDAGLEAALDQHMSAIINQLTNDGPELRHCMFCGIGHSHLFDKCPILNEKRFLTSFAIRVGSAYQRTLNDAFKRQKEA